jgi:hypothetical protein
MHLIVLDLNGVVCQKKPGGKPAVLRPHVRTLLEGVLQLQQKQLCRVAIWTSMTAPNAQVIINQLLTLQEQSECLFIWSRDQCESFCFRQIVFIVKAELMIQVHHIPQ